MKRLLPILSALLFLAACNISIPFIGGDDEELPPPVALPEGVIPEAAPVEPEPTQRETSNVTFTGTVQPAGVTIYQEGTHRLKKDDGDFLLLESTTVDLNGYVDESVSVTGAIRPTVEEGGMIMRVETIELLEPLTGSGMTATGSAMDETEPSPPPSEASPPEPEPEQPDDLPPPESEPETEPTPVEPNPEPEETEPTPTPEQPEPTAQVPASPVTWSPAVEATIVAMAAEDIGSYRWTQNYCNSHIGFCFPIHKNWWYKSFGNTTSNLWHVEISNANTIENLGDGAIEVNVVSGPLPEGGADGKVVTEANLAVGYKSWDTLRHFEVRADERLRGAVEYILSNLTVVEEQQ